MRFPGTADEVVATADSLGFIPDAAATIVDAEALMEGWAMAAAYEVASALADGGVVDIDGLLAAGRLSDHARPWLVNILVNLEAAGLARRDKGAWALIEDDTLPRSMEVVRALATEQQSYAGEMLLAAALSGFVGNVAVSKTVTGDPDRIVGKTALDFYHSANLATRESSDALFRILTENERFWPSDRALRILEIGYSQLSQSLLSSSYARSILLTVFEPDRRRFESADLSLSKTEARLIDADHIQELGTFDLIVSAGALHRLPASFDVADIRDLLAPRGMLVAIEPRSSLFKDLTFGLDPDWFSSGATDRPVSRLRPATHWPNDLDDVGFVKSSAAVVRCGASSGSLIVAQAPAADITREEAGAPRSERSVPAAALPGASAQEASFAARLKAVLTTLIGADAFVLPPEDSDDPADPVDALTRRCLALRESAEKFDGRAGALWLIFRGALAAGLSPVRPVETAGWAFSRTLANEFPKLDIRRIDVAADLSAETATAEIQKILTSGTTETELQIARQATRAVRVVHLRNAAGAQSKSQRGAATLRRRGSSGQRLAWEPMERKRPGKGEVEVEVQAAGVNFRDLMFSLGFLPEDMLENGFSGASLGLEFAGKVVHVGAGVTGLHVGDRVLGFAGSSFATHLTVKAEQAVKLPSNLSCEAAATIPVAFFTAYYSLLTQARLSRREWVLIHGGAGGVGLAAIQVAQSRGARIIASAGSPAKRDLLRAMGVRHVVDSRSTTFVDDVRRITGQGVDVVLNSLAGEAMERSIGCLRPFGRFVELGKRDYVGNTHVGLRPFRQNLSYFGVDVDQVMNGRAALGAQTFARIMKQFEKGAFVPLPYTVFDASDVSEAFHVMQKSVHIGKVVVRPNVNGGALPQAQPFVADSAGTHIVTGAFSGFGMETAKWLVEKGARYIVMLGRRGPSSPEAKAVVQNLQARGVQVVAEPCDVTDRVALERVFESLRSTMPPIVGVMHGAMVLDDALLTNLDEERFHRVLAPKVTGAENLDRLVRGLPLDYFVMFSSISTLIGNPGQANYVAANAYMEGLARRRRQKGLAALAVGWGPISDVGVIARNKRLRGVAEKISDGAGLLAREALDLMARAIQQSSDGVESAVITIAPQDGSLSSDRLAVLRSPTYAALVNRDNKLRETDVDSIDLHALAAGHGIEAARKKVVDVVSAQLAHVLHLRKEDISPMRPLGEIGLDSLMAVELAMNLENAFHIQVPFQSSSGAMTVSAIADEVIAQIGLDPDREDVKMDALVQQHVADPDEIDRGALKEIVSDEKQAAKRLLS